MLVIFVMFDNKSKRGNAEIIINAIDTNSSPYNSSSDICPFFLRFAIIKD